MQTPLKPEMALFKSEKVAKETADSPCPGSSCWPGNRGAVSMGIVVARRLGLQGPARRRGMATQRVPAARCGAVLSSSYFAKRCSSANGRSSDIYPAYSYCNYISTTLVQRNVDTVHTSLSGSSQDCQLWPPHTHHSDHWQAHTHPATLRTRKRRSLHSAHTHSHILLSGFCRGVVTWWL